MRKLLRNKARANMRKAGLVKVNKPINGKSFFSQNWRDYIDIKNDK